MPKAILEFNLPEENEEFNHATNGSKYKNQIEELWQHMFRPRHKHGYINDRINELLKNEDCNELMDLLESVYHEVTSEE